MELLIKLITTGRGSSGYYNEEVLRRDGAEAFPAGTKILNTHINNNEFSDARMGQGVSGDDFVGQLLEPAYYSESPDGAGLYARAEIFRDYVERWGEEKIRAMEFSIFSAVEWEEGEAPDGIEGRIATRLIHTPHNTVDAVVFGGAGGRTVSVIASESANLCNGSCEIIKGLSVHMMDANNESTPLSDGDNKGQSDMDLEKKVAELEEELKAAKASLTAETAEKEAAQDRANLAEKALQEANAIARERATKDALDGLFDGVEFIGTEAEELVRAKIGAMVKWDGDKLNLEELTEATQGYRDGTSDLVVGGNSGASEAFRWEQYPTMPSAPKGKSNAAAEAMTELTSFVSAGEGMSF